MAESDSSLTQKITPNSPKLEEFNSSLKIKLKLPKIDQDYLQKNNILIKSAPNNQEDDEEEPEDDYKQVIEEENVLNLKICHVCNRSFSNGKALGGHMRVHTANYKAKKKVSTAVGSTSRSNSMSSPEAGEAGGETHQGVFKCDLCPKEFRSLKSLFGHMRSHPERLWRGMNPPRQLLTYLTAEDSSAAEARLRSLGSWRVTGKRGRKASCSSPVGSSTSSFGSHAEAAADLMLLLAGGGGGPRRGKECGVVDDVDFFDDDDDEVSRANKKGKGLIVINDEDNNERLFDEDEVYYLKNLGFLPNYKVNDDVNDGVIRVHNNNLIINNNFDNHHGDSIKVLASSSSPKIKGIKKVAKINHKTINYSSESIELNYHHHHHYPNPNQIEINPNKFPCTTCGKSYSTYQALGGHRSSHNKDKYNNNNNNSDNMMVIQTRGVDASGLTDTGPISEIGGGDSDNGQGQGGQGQYEVEAVVIGEYKCKICNKTFASGRALGGHQRSHSVPLTDNSSLSLGQTSYQTGPKGNLELFDLNEPAMMNVDNNDDEDDVIIGNVTFDYSN